MQDKIIEILSKASDWMTTDEVAHLVPSTNKAAVEKILSQSCKGKNVTVTSRMINDEYGRNRAWKHADKEFDDAKAEPAIAAPPKPAVKPTAKAATATLTQLTTPVESEEDKEIARLTAQANQLERELEVSRKLVIELKAASEREPVFEISGLTGYHAAKDKITLLFDRRLKATALTANGPLLHQMVQLATS